MDWQTLLASPLAIWIPILILVIFISLLFRAQIAGLIHRLIGLSVKAGKVEVNIQATQGEPQAAPLPQSPEPVQPARPVNTAPPKTYRRLFGRQEDIDNVMRALRDPAQKIILLTGLGGIGKTALAREVVEQSLTEGLFEFVVWTTAKTEQFVGERIQNLPANNLTFDVLVEQLARQVGREDILRMRPQDREAAVQAMLATKKVLILADNLDTAGEKEALLEKLAPLLGRSKAVCTSRYTLKNDQVYMVQLRGLSAEASRDFLRDEASTRNLASITDASNGILNRIHKVTGGAPLAMKLVIGQVSRQPLNNVLETLEKASINEHDYEFYRYIYQGSWNLLGSGAQQALVSMAIFPPVTGGAVEDVKELVGADSPSFWTDMDRLVTFSLVDKIGPAGRERFALHPLTQYFVLSDIVKKWAAPNP